jgi:hypothetical protein
MLAIFKNHYASTAIEQINIERIRIELLKKKEIVKPTFPGSNFSA